MSRWSECRRMRGHPTHRLLHWLCRVVHSWGSSRLLQRSQHLAPSLTPRTTCLVPKSQACSFRRLNQPILLLLPRASIVRQAVSSNKLIDQMCFSQSCPWGNLPSPLTNRSVLRRCQYGSSALLAIITHCADQSGNQASTPLLLVLLAKEQWEGKVNTLAW